MKSASFLHHSSLSHTDGTYIFVIKSVATCSQCFVLSGCSETCGKFFVETACEVKPGTAQTHLVLLIVKFKI
jgi:hypothetical protein